MIKEKIESYHVGSCYYINRYNMHGNYCPETGEYYLACHEDACEVVIASYWYDSDNYCHAYSQRGYSYDVVRELLRLGHLTKKTLEQFQQAGGEVWWNQP